MRSLVILEVEHGDTTDPLMEALDAVLHRVNAVGVPGAVVNDYTVRVDLPACFVLDK